MYAPLGEHGQQRLLASRALVCGCGALGSVIANTLARAGVGKLRIVDRDFLEQNNLQRQFLFDEQDVKDGLPKAVAAANHLRGINSQIDIEPIVADVNPDNIQALCDGVDIILDGTDNFETRFLLNDAAIKFAIPWIYGGCIGAEGQALTIMPEISACLRCLLSDAPPPGTTPTCDTAGILAPIIGVIASLQSMEAIKILSGNAATVSRALTVIDLWDNSLRQVRVEPLREAGGCETCGQRQFPWLEGRRGSHTAVLCGRNAVQLTSPASAHVSLAQLAGKLEPLGPVTRNAYLLRFAIDPYQLTIFSDGRAIISGTNDVATARSLYARYIGA
jgi:adenylyltransferase/sulfurtransferase